MSMSRVSRIDLPLSMLSSTAKRRECFCTPRASAYSHRARACGVSACQPGSASRAAATAAFTSCAVPWETRASVARVAGLMTSNVSPGSLQRPPMNWPKTPSCFANHDSASLSLSGAGPYSSDSKISATDDISSLGHWHAMAGRVSASHEMLELPLDVREESARADPEQIRPQPAVAELVLHEIHVLEHVLGAANTTCWFEANGVSCLLLVLADHPRHHQREGERRIHAFLPRRRLDEVRSCLHRDDARARDLVERRQLDRGENRLHVRVATGVTKCLHLVVERVPVAGEHVGARDDDVDL